MGACHAQLEIVAEVVSDLVYRIQMTRRLGELYGANAGEPIKKMDGFANLWESRVRHPTGQYRQFFAFVDIDGVPSLVYDRGMVKRRGQLPRKQLEVANTRLATYIHELETNSDRRERDRIREPQEDN
jgi:Phage derived protein Gp49-like (DUF891)